MSSLELALAESRGHHVPVAHRIVSDGAEFAVLGVKDNGDCAALGDAGCTLGDLRPLWCKAYYCEELYDGANPYRR